MPTPSHPLNSSLYGLRNSKLPRPPIYNPYEKFTQPEFDSWIGDITSALRRALGHADNVAQSQVQRSYSREGSPNAAELDRVASAEASDDDEPDVSFADTKACRIIGKGKARDPREGPGLGVGDWDQPIEILSDSEEDRSEEEPGVEYDVDGQSEEEVWAEATQSDDDEEYSDEQGQSSSRLLLSYSRKDHRDSEEEEEGEGDEEEAIVTQLPRTHSEVTEFLSDEEEANLAASDDAHNEGLDELSDEECISTHFVSEGRLQTRDVEEDVKVGSDVGEGSVEVEVEDKNEVYHNDDDTPQPWTEDTSFPPHSAMRGTEVQRPIEIPDLWDGPRTYAEDFYSGGDVLSTMAVSADRLGPVDRDDGFIDLDLVTPAHVDEIDDSLDGEMVEANKVHGSHEDINEELELRQFSDSGDPKWSNADFSNDEAFNEFFGGVDQGGTEEIPSQDIQLELIPLEVKTSTTLEAVKNDEEASSALPFTRNRDISPGPGPPSSISPTKAMQLGEKDDIDHLSFDMPLEEFPVSAEASQQIESLFSNFLSAQSSAMGDSTLQQTQSTSTDENEMETQTTAVDIIPTQAFLQIEIEKVNNMPEVGEGDLDTVLQGASEGAQFTHPNDLYPQEKPTGILERVIMEPNDEVYLKAELTKQPAPSSLSPSLYPPIEVQQPIEYSVENSALKSNVRNEEEDDIRSTPGVESEDEPQQTPKNPFGTEAQIEPGSVYQSEPQDLPNPTPVVHLYDFGIEQLLTPPSEQSAVATPAPVEDVEDDDDDDPSQIPGLGVFAKRRKLQAENKEAAHESISPPNETYTVNSPTTNEVSKEMKTEEMNQVEMDEIDMDIEVLSHIDAVDNDLQRSYFVEEAISETEEQLTENLDSRATSIGIISVDLDNTQDHATSAAFSWIDTSEDEIPGLQLYRTAKRETVQRASNDSDSPSTDSHNTPATTEQVEEPKDDLYDSTVDQQTDESSISVNIAATPESAKVVVPVTPDRPHTPLNRPLVLNLPGTPLFMQSPVGTPVPGVPTPVFVPLPKSMISALKNQALWPEPGVSLTPDQGDSTDHHDVDTEYNQEQLVQAAEKLVPSIDEQDKEETSVPAIYDKFLGSTSDSNLELDSPTLKNVPEANSKAEWHPLTDVATDGVTSLDQIDTTTTQSVPVQSSLLPFSLPYTASPISQSMKVTMTRKTTDPILYADPYPYSLSTPGTGYSLNDPSKDDVSEEDTELDNSISTSSTVDKDLDDKATEDFEGLELQYPPETSRAPSEMILNSDIKITPSQAISEPIDANAKDAEGEDTDAIGDIDPEFAGVLTSLTSSQPALNPTKEEDPFKLMGNNSVVAPGAVEDSVNSNASEDESDTSSYLSSKSTYIPDVAADANGGESEKTPVEMSPFASGVEAASGTEENKDDRISDEKSDGSSKRKRALSPSRPSHFTSQRVLIHATSPVKVNKRPKNRENMNGNGVIHVKPKPKPRPVGKAKEQAQGREESEKPSESSADSWSSSGASAALRLLRPNSRASSVASSAPSDKSLIIQPSPTVDKPSNRPILPPPPLLHAHGRGRPIIGRQHSNSFSAGPSLQLERQIQKASSFSRPSDHRSQAPSNLLATTSSQPTSHRSVPSSSSPVTRSHCRYHKISLPKEEGGPRVCFLVPGCSLNDRELMEEEEIEDHGDATHEDSARMVEDVETLDFDLYLIGVLRQLVGVDILRAQEVFYLPRPGEELSRSHQSRKKTSEKYALTRVPSRDPPASNESISAAGSPGHSLLSVRSSKAPRSIAGSTSGSSALRAALGSDDSLSSITSSGGETDVEDVPKSKRFKSTASPGKIPGTSVTSSTQQKPPTRRNRRLGNDAFAFKPESDDESTGEEYGDPRHGKRGVKRSRLVDAASVEDSESRKPKKQRTRTNTMSERG